jgi:hypothetical protein
MHLNFLDTALCLRVVETLLHFLWQGFAIGLAMWTINAFVAHSKSNLRYRLNLFALLLMAACLPLTFGLLPAHESASVRVTNSVPVVASNTNQTTKNEIVPVEPVEPPLDPPPAVPPRTTEPVAEADFDEEETLPLTPVAAADTEEAKLTERTSDSWLRAIAPYATVVYAIGVFLMLLRLLLAVWGGQRLRAVSQVIDEPGLLENLESLARRLGLKVAPLVATCSRISGPVVVGILKPMILLPPSLVSSMSPAQLEAVLSHELAHLRRFDLIINLLQRLIEALLFFHPAVWYVSHRVSVERENSCDDLVMEHGCDRLTYADALLRMAEICTDSSRQRGLESAAALAATGSQPSEFKSRVLRVVGETNGPPLRLTRWGLALLAAMLISFTALPWILGSHKFGSEALKGTTYSNQDGEFVYALHTDQKIVYALIVNYPEEQDFTWKCGGKSKSLLKRDVLEYLEAKWGNVSFRTEFESDNPKVVRFFSFSESEEIQPGDLRGYTPFSLQDGRIFYCDPSTHTFEQRTTLKDALPERPPVPNAKPADTIEKVVHLIEADFAPEFPALDLSGRITDSKFIDTVADEVARLRFATSWQSENARQFARQIARQYLSPDMPAEERRRILVSLHDYVTSFLDRHRDESDDDVYTRRPHDVRNLLWRLKLALVRKPNDEASAQILESQLAEVRKWMQTVPPHRFSHLTSEAVVARLEQRRADPLEPIFKYPLPDQEFERMMRELGKLESTLDSAIFHAIAKWFNADVRSTPGLVVLTGTPDVKFISHGTSGADVNVGYPSTKVWSGHGTMIREWSDIIDLSRNAPGTVGFGSQQSVSQAKAGDDEFRKWAEEESHNYGHRGHIAFDYQKRRLVGIQGTRFVKLDVDSFVAADQLNGELIKDRIRQRGRDEFVFPEPKSVVDQPAHHQLIYDLYLGALTEDERLYVLKIEKIETDVKGLWYHARLHNPPHPDEVTFFESHGSHDHKHADGHDHDHDHSELTPEAQMKKVIGRFDADYWKTVDIAQLIADKQIAFSPDRECLALLRDQTLYAIESVRGHFQEYEVKEKADLVEWKSGSIHVVTENGENRFYTIRRPGIQFLDGNADPVSAERLMEARIGYSSPHSDWMMYSKPGRPMSLMGLKPGTHWLITGARDLFAVSLPLGSRDPNLPEEVSLNGEVTERKTPSGTVREVRRRLQPQPRIQVSNVSAKASVKTLGNGRELLLVEIQNNSGERLQFSERHIYLETEVNNQHERVLSPSWTQENNETKWPEITIEDGAKGIMDLDWNRWRSRGVWFRGFVVAPNTKGLGLIEQIPGKLHVRVYGPGFRTRPVAVSLPKTEQAADRQPAAPTNPQPNAGDRTPPGNPAPEPIDATTLELYNRYIAKVGKIESASVQAAIELVAARGSGDGEFRALLRNDFATSRQEDNQSFDSRKLLALITKVLYREGGMRWQLEYEKQTGQPGQRVLPPGDALYRESPLLTDVIKYGRKCGRSEIDDFVFAVRQAHHPQGKQFLLDVLNNPSDPGNPFEGSDKTKGKWPDNIGGGWEEARFIAAVGLAELNVEEGVRWLIEHARPDDFGTGAELRKKCNRALHSLSGLQNKGEEFWVDWDTWWRENKDSFSPRRVYLMEPPGY